MSKKIIVESYNVELDNSDFPYITLEMTNIKDETQHQYNFSGDMPMEEWNKVAEIIKEHNGVIPVVEGRQIWDILVKHCEVNEDTEEIGKLF